VAVSCQSAPRKPFVPLAKLTILITHPHSTLTPSTCSLPSSLRQRLPSLIPHRLLSSAWFFCAPSPQGDRARQQFSDKPSTRELANPNQGTGLVNVPKLYHNQSQLHTKPNTLSYARFSGPNKARFSDGIQVEGPGCLSDHRGSNPSTIKDDGYISTPFQRSASTRCVTSTPTDSSWASRAYTPCNAAFTSKCACLPTATTHASKLVTSVPFIHIHPGLSLENTRGN